MSRYLELTGALYAKRPERRLRTCPTCKRQFTDITKQFRRITCSSECQAEMCRETHRRNRPTREFRRNTDKSDRECWVYVITCKVNDKKYVGKSIMPQKRWRNHVKVAMSLTPNRPKFKLHNAIAKYGPENFDFEIHSHYDNEQQAFDAEVELIKVFNAVEGGYNMNAGGEGGGTPSQEVRDKISQVRKAGGYRHSVETRRKISKSRSGEKHPGYGKKYSDETRQRMSAKRTLYWANKRALKEQHENSETLCQSSQS